MYRIIDKAISVEPENDSYIEDKAMYLTSAQHYEEAIQSYLMLKNKDYRTYSSIGYLYQVLNNFEEAERYYTKGVDSAEDDFVKQRVLNAKAEFYSDKDKPFKAIECYKQILDLPECYNKEGVYESIALVYAEMEEYNKAAEYMYKSIEAFPYSRNIAKTGIFCYLAKRYNEAIELYKKVFEIIDIEDKEVKVYYNNIANCYKNTEQYDLAIKSYNKSLIIKNYDSLSISIDNHYKNLLGEVYFFKGKCLIEMNELKDDIIMSFFKAKEYGYHEDECNEIIKKIKMNS